MVDNAATDGFSLSFASTTWLVARVTLGKKKSDTTVVEDTYLYILVNSRYSRYKHTLFHWESLLVVTTSDTEDVTLPFISEMIGWDFLQGKMSVNAIPNNINLLT